MKQALWNRELLYGYRVKWRAPSLLHKHIFPVSLMFFIIINDNNRCKDLDRNNEMGTLLATLGFKAFNSPSLFIKKAKLKKMSFLNYLLKPSNRESILALTSWCRWSFVWTLRTPGVQLYGDVRFHFWFKFKQSTSPGTKLSRWGSKEAPLPTTADVGWRLVFGTLCGVHFFTVDSLSFNTEDIRAAVKDNHS